MHEQADGRHRAGRHPTALARNLVQHLAPPSELGVGQELLPHVLGVHRDELARVAVYRDNAPALGEGKHVRQHVDRNVGYLGGRAQALVQLHDVSALYRGEGQPAERRHDVPVDDTAMFRDRPARIAALRYNAPACGRAVHVCQDLDDRARRRRAILDLINGRAIRRQQRYPHDLQPIQSTETHL